jgi:hypothetical protein
MCCNGSSRKNSDIKLEAGSRHEPEVCNVSCLTCFKELSAKNALEHMHSCFRKHDAQLTVWNNM